MSRWAVKLKYKQTKIADTLTETFLKCLFNSHQLFCQGNWKSKMLNWAFVVLQSFTQVDHCGHWAASYWYFHRFEKYLNWHYIESIPLSHQLILAQDSPVQWSAPVKMLKNSQDNRNCQETQSVAPTRVVCVHVRGKFNSSEWTKTRKITGHLGLFN